MNLRDLKYVVAVAELKHFGRAAEKSFISQPTLSMQIKKLEDELEVQIFERRGKEMIITEIGEKIISKAKIIIKEAEEIKALSKITKDPFAGSLKIGAFPTIAVYLFPQFVPKITKKFPQLKLFLIEEKTEILLQKLKSGEIDLAIMALPINDDGLKSVKLFSEEFLLAVNLKNELAKKNRVNTGDLNKKSLLLLEEGHCLRDQALAVCSNLGAYADQDFRATSLETLRQMVNSGNGITLIPKIAVNKNYPQIKYIPFSNPKPARSIAIFWRKSSARVECYQAIAELIKQNSES